ncbi:hypothetical protein BRADI_4g03625v3 [Brachypodium distachyon]|uniref:Uncharacterized protein n=1 Tax=Brachypodium distachyon TaxID=15368 RepID=A0A2K2CK97_BRADI|nr:hypothetical protein BRADI_4g03625v3 [Brachypodium distachyon]
MDTEPLPELEGVIVSAPKPYPVARARPLLRLVSSPLDMRKSKFRNIRASPTSVVTNYFFFLLNMFFFIFFSMDPYVILFHFLILVKRLLLLQSNH